MGKLKDIEVQAWVRTGKPIAGKSDGDGLTFTLSAKGTASWVFRYRLGGKQRELSIGTIDTTSKVTEMDRQAQLLAAHLRAGLALLFADAGALDRSCIASTRPGIGRGYFFLNLYAASV